MDADKCRILLVDDEEDNLALMNRTLRHDFSVVRTTSPEDALYILKNEDIDIIISDHKMPEMDGVEFLKRSCEIRQECVRLLVTAYSDSSILIDAINHGKIYRYIKKPWEPSELLLVVKAAVEYFYLKRENDKLIKDFKDLFAGTINAIIEALDAKDAFTLGKSKRVTFFALKMAEYFNLKPEESSKLELAGLLHDIGMIGVSEEILSKTEKLTENEFETIKKHVLNGVKILEDIKQLRQVIDVMKYHHERYDGGGYPFGLKGEDIPFSARILAVADAYDSMISDRSYRTGLSYQDALKIVDEQSGLQFDPVVVQAFKTILPSAIEEIDEYRKRTGQAAEQV